MRVAAAAARAVVPVEPWWLRLPEDFHRQPDGTELDADHRLKVHGTAVLDRVVRSGLSTLLSVAAGPSMLTPRRMREQLWQLAFYEQLALAGDVDRAFPAPPTVAVQQATARRLSWKPGNIPHRVLRFDSPFEALNPALRARYRSHPHNRQAYAQHWHHPGGPRPTLIVIHGFVIDAYWLNAQMFSLRWFYRNGYDVLLYTLPFHGYRGGPRDWFSGHRLLADGLPQFNEAMAHAIHDLRIFMDHLQREGVTQMGVTGLSLGGYTSALAASVDRRLAFCIPNSPLVTPIDVLREWVPTGPTLAAILKFHGLRLRELRAGIAVNSPLTWAPRIGNDRLLIIGGAGDRFTPPRHVRLLHAHWPGSEVHWFPGNHVLHLQQAAYLQRMKHFMDRRCAAPAGSLP